MAMLEQAQDFAAECDALAVVLDNAAEEDFSKATQFKGWTIDDVLVHLHFWNHLADLSLNQPDRFAAAFEGAAMAFANRTVRAFENASVDARGRALLDLWRSHAAGMAERWLSVDPKRRVRWAGPEMSARSSITARQMETWAHGQEIFDLFGVVREETDRIRNIVVLGVNTYGRSFAVRGLTPPGPMPRLALVAPSGATWHYGEGEGLISGSAVAFAQVVAQTRNIADTGLKVEGEAATAWMANAQCFAGPPETPPAPGTRGPSARPA
jgi:uncharacterized protein (TIGR03084 family)